MFSLVWFYRLGSLPLNGRVDDRLSEVRTRMEPLKKAISSLEKAMVHKLTYWSWAGFTDIDGNRPGHQLPGGVEIIDGDNMQTVRDALARLRVDLEFNKSLEKFYQEKKEAIKNLSTEQKLTLGSLEYAISHIGIYSTHSGMADMDPKPGVQLPGGISLNPTTNTPKLAAEYVKKLKSTLAKLRSDFGLSGNPNSAAKRISLLKTNAKTLVQGMRSIRMAIRHRIRHGSFKGLPDLDGNKDGYQLPGGVNIRGNESMLELRDRLARMRAEYQFIRKLQRFYKKHSEKINKLPEEKRQALESLETAIMYKIHYAVFSGLMDMDPNKPGHQLPGGITVDKYDNQTTLEYRLAALRAELGLGN